MSAGHTFAEAQARQANADRVVRYLTGKPPTPLADIVDDNPRIGGGTKAGVLLDYMVRHGLVRRIPQPSRRALYALPGAEAVTSTPAGSAPALDVSPHPAVAASGTTTLHERAKAGDQRAVNALLTATEPAFRRAALYVLRRTRTDFNVYDEAVAAAREVAWRSIPSWDPERAPLWGYCWEMMIRRVRSVVRRNGHTTFSRKLPAGAVVGLDAPIGAESGSRTWVDVLPGAAVDPAHAVDAERVLARMKPSYAEVLWRTACGEDGGEIADSLGCSTQNINQKLGAALRDARTVADDSAAVRTAQSPEDAVVRILAHGPVSSLILRRLLRGLLRGLPGRRLDKVLAKMRRDDVIEIRERNGVHVVYGMKEAR